MPVLSWVVLRGRCRDCGTGISWRYPLVEATTAALFAATAALVGNSWALPAYLYLAAIAVALTLIDLEHYRLPDVIVIPSYLVASALLALASWGGGDWGALLRALIGGAGLWLLYEVLYRIRPGGIGGGDVKLAGVLGLYLAWWGWPTLAVGSFAAFLFGGLVGGILMVAGRAGRKSRIPFGPYMLIGCFTALFVGAPVSNWYLNVVGLSSTV